MINHCQLCKCVVGEDPESGARAGLYPGIARINHSCAPNVVWSWTRGNARRKQVRAVIKSASLINSQITLSILIPYIESRLERRCAPIISMTSTQITIQKTQDRKFYPGGASSVAAQSAP